MAQLDALRPRLSDPPRRGDLIAGVSVALVLLPQAVAYAVLAGVPPRSGLVVAVISTIIAAPFLSAPLLQTGPTAITSLLTLGSLTSVAATTNAEPVALAALLALLVGVVRLTIAARGAGEVAYLVSEPVLIAFTAAAGVVIALSQIPNMLGSSVVASGVAAEAVKAVTTVGDWNPVAIAYATATIVVLVVAGRLHPLIPGVLIVVVIGITVQLVVAPDVSIVGEIPSALPRLMLSLPWQALPDLAVPALVLGLVGFSEASAIARSFATDAGEPWDADREFASQGFANLAAGVVGGMPVGASFSRSAVNRAAGARTAWSGAITGGVVLIALPFVGLLEDLPRAVLAGIIIAAVVSLVDPRPLLALRRYSRQQFYIGLTTYVLTILFAPQIQWAVLIGVMLVIAAHLRRERKVDVQHVVDGTTLRLHPVGLLHFGSVQRVEDQVRVLLRRYPDTERLVLHLGRVGRTDVTGALVLRRLLLEAVARGVRVELADITITSRAVVTRVLQDEPTLIDALPPDTEAIGSPWDDTPFGTGDRG